MYNCAVLEALALDQRMQLELMKKGAERSESVKELLKGMPVTGMDEILSFDKVLEALALDQRMQLERP